MHVNNRMFAYYDQTFDLILPITERLMNIITCVILTNIYAYLWSSYGIGQTIIFLPCGFFFYLSPFFLFFA